MASAAESNGTNLLEWRQAMSRFWDIAQGSILMKKPIIMTVDDDPEVLQAIGHDLRSAYGDRFRIMRVDSGERALDVLRQVKLANEVVALMLVDQRMPGVTGVELLSQASPIFPEAKRALLTAYADTDAAIKAINDIHLDYYLMKPWDPPETRLYPVLDDLLDDWLAGFRPEFEGVRLIGHRWSPESHEVRNFLARNQVPFRWYSVETDAEATELLTLANATSGAVSSRDLSGWIGEGSADQRADCRSARGERPGRRAAL